MRYLALFILALISCNSFASHTGEFVPRYRVLSDTLDSSLEPGMVKVTGHVFQKTYNQQTFKWEEQGISHVKVSTISHSVSTLSGGLGEYEMIIKDSDTSLYMYKYGLTEVVIYHYPFKSQHHVVIDFLPDYSPPGDMDITEKPVIYAYSDKEITAQIGVKQVGEMTFTYPNIEDGWKFTTSPNGAIKMNDRNYPYLFWEAERPTVGLGMNGKLIPGTYVSKDNVIDFLEEKLTQLGLTDKEQADFITYWGPRLSAYEKSFVQFKIDTEVAPLIGELEITPKPDALRRVFMTFVDADRMNLYAIYATQTQEFETFKREGFTVIEWGGTELENATYVEN